MAFFKFRKGGGDAVATPTQSESVEAVRRRARQRLIGAAVLVLAGVIGFPLVFDTQPRPIAVDIPIDIPDRAKTSKPLGAPAVATGSVTRADGPAPQPPSAFVPAASLSSQAAAPAASQALALARPADEAGKPEPKSETAPAAAPENKSAASDAKSAHRDAKSEAKAGHGDAKPEAKAKPDPKPEAKADSKDGDRAKALLEGKTPPAADGRFVIQVGAFSDATKAQAARNKLEKAGLKTYTHVAETKEGKRIRVRVGPFTSRAEAEKAAGKVKGQDLPAAILTL